jgi:hypothetical protein
MKKLKSLFERCVHKFYRITLVVLGYCLSTGLVQAQERMAQIMIDRGNSQLSAFVPVLVMANSQALATVVLLPGGDAGTGKMIAGKPSSGNFLSRSREFFYEAGFNVVVAYRPSDLSNLEYDYRTSKAHIAEIEKVLAFAKQEFGKPVWLVGTSRGSVSATATAIALGSSQVQGLVLTSSVTSKKDGAIGSQAIATLQMPTLVVHHKNDACHICVPAEAAKIVDSLTAAPMKRFVMIEGGANPQGETCAAKHWHGFINFEKETVNVITSWIKNPQN